MLNKEKMVVALGYFDCVHKGHRQVIECAKNLSKQLNAKTLVFTFEGNLRSFTNGKDGKYVYNLEERISLFNDLGVEQIYSAPLTSEFLSLSKQEFLDFINQKFSIEGYVCGCDYRFGKNASGNVDYLVEYAKAHKQQVVIAPSFTYEGQKVSTSDIKKYLSTGEIEKANAILGYNYFISGEVYKDRGLGKELGFPTANIKVDSNRTLLKNGVYSGYCLVDDKKYKAVINYGSRPTFNLEQTTIEAHLIGFSGDLYHKIIKIFFTSYIRDIIKFDKQSQLKEQLLKDVEKVIGND